MSAPDPYAGPQDPALQEESIVPGGRALPAGRGWTWIVRGWALFKRQPGMWIALVVVLAVLFLVTAMIPFIGSIALMVLLPVFAAGFMIGCRALESGAPLELGHLFAGFRERFGTLAAVGGLYLAFSIAIALVVGLITGASMVSPMDGAATPAVLLSLLAMAAFMIPLAMAVWFAPPLVVFHGRGAMDAMRESFTGCLRNLVPFLLYGVILFVAGALASIPFGLGWLVLGPVTAASVYTAYRDIYFA